MHGIQHEHRLQRTNGGKRVILSGWILNHLDFSKSYDLLGSSQWTLEVSDYFQRGSEHFGPDWRTWVDEIIGHFGRIEIGRKTGTETYLPDYQTLYQKLGYHRWRLSLRISNSIGLHYPEVEEWWMVNQIG